MEIFLGILNVVLILGLFCFVQMPIIFLMNQKNPKFQTYFVCDCGAHYIASHNKRFFLDHKHCPGCGNNKENYDQVAKRRILTGKWHSPWTWREGYWQEKSEANTQETDQ